MFALRFATIGYAAFRKAEPGRVRGERAIYGDADWMKTADAVELFPEAGGIILGERYRVDKDDAGAGPFRE
jgi:type IV secretion system protein VirD4